MLRKDIKKYEQRKTELIWLNQNGQVKTQYGRTCYNIMNYHEMLKTNKTTLKTERDVM